MKTLARTLALAAFFLTVTVTALRAGGMLDHARRAQALLGSEVWSQVIRIENTNRAGRYPRVVHALVFELADVLWFYTSMDGTQSFSLHRGRLAEEKADFGPLLRDVDRGFTGWSAVENAPLAPGATRGFPNGCFIESVVALRDRLGRGLEVVRPQLLSFYTGARDGAPGHTVLAYETAGHVEVVDSAQAERRFSFPAALARDAVKLARAMLGDRVVHARLFPIDWPAARGGYSAMMPAAGAAVASSG